MNTTRTAREAGIQWFERVWNQRDAAAAIELMLPNAPGFLEGGQNITGPEQFLQFQTGFLAAVPDMAIEIIETVADDHNVCLHWTASGTHTGEGLGMKPTGKPIAFRGVTWFKVDGGRITEGRDFWNQESLMRVMAGGEGAATI